MDWKYWWTEEDEVEVRKEQIDKLRLSSGRTNTTQLTSEDANYLTVGDFRRQED